MARGYLPWGGELTPEERLEKAKKKAYLEDYKLAVRYTPFMLPYEIIDLIAWQHEYYDAGDFEMAGICFEQALDMFIEWRDNNYEELNYDLYDNFDMTYPEDDNDLLAGFFGWTGDIVD